VCDNFARQFHFLWVPSMKNINLNIFKNLTVKVCRIWCNDVYVSILQCGIFWWKLIDRNYFNPIFNTKVVLGASPFLLQFPLFCTWLSPNRIFRYARYFIFIQQQHSSVLKPKYSLSIRNKCAYLLESSETSITIWRQEYPQNCYI
jgi:hypothetical protein